MKKSLTLIAAALILSMSLAGCGSDSSNDKSGNSSDNQQSVEQNYSKNVDMDKVEGTEASSDTEENEYDGELGAVEVTIEDAKLINYEGKDVAVVSFSFKNNSNAPVSFNGAMKIDAYQNDQALPVAVVANVEGVELMSMTQNVATGESITVQKAYKLKDKSLPLVVQARRFNQNNSDDVLVKTFNF